MPFGNRKKNILEDLLSSVLSQFKKYRHSWNLKFNNFGNFQSRKFRIFTGKIPLISLKLDFNQNTLCCYGLKSWSATCGQELEKQVFMAEERLITAPYYKAMPRRTGLAPGTKGWSRCFPVQETENISEIEFFVFGSNSLTRNSSNRTVRRATRWWWSFQWWCGGPALKNP